MQTVAILIVTVGHNQWVCVGEWDEGFISLNSMEFRKICLWFHSLVLSFLSLLYKDLNATAVQIELEQVAFGIYHSSSWCWHSDRGCWNWGSVILRNWKPSLKYFRIPQTECLQTLNQGTDAQEKTVWMSQLLIWMLISD